MSEIATTARKTSPWFGEARAMHRFEVDLPSGVAAVPGDELRFRFTGNAAHRFAVESASM